MENLREKTCCFTGHRTIPVSVSEALQQKAEKKIMELYNRGVIYYGCGGALGFDTLMAQTCFALRDSGSCPQMKVILVYPFDGFTDRWNGIQIATYKELFKKFDKVVCVSSEASREAYLARNRHLVGGSAFCIAYCVHQRSGTGYTVRYAQKQGVEIYNLAE